MIRLIDQSLMAGLSEAAGQAPRRRVHRNFHPDDAYPAHRLLVAIEPGSYVPHGMFHSVLALEPGTVIFEAKAGPYVPIAPEERATWAPAEGDVGVADYLVMMRKVGQWSAT